MFSLGMGCLRCQRRGVSDIFSVCAGHLLLPTRPFVNPCHHMIDLPRHPWATTQSFHPTPPQKKEKRKFGHQRFPLWGQILWWGKPGINHTSAASWTVQIYTCWIYVAEAIWQKSIRGLVVRAGRRLMRTTYCTQEKVSGREAEWKTELWEWWMDGSERRAEKGSRKRWLVPDWLSDSLLVPLTHHLHAKFQKVTNEKSMYPLQTN